MKIRSLIITMLALTGAGVLHAQRGRSVGCDKILNPNKVESFTQRLSCAGQAMAEGDEARAFDLMAPIYKDAIGSKSNTRVDSQAKLRKIVELKLGAATDQLVGKYGADSVYAAIADASGINPLTGKETKGASKVVLPAELVTAVANAINAGPSRPAAPAEEGGVPQAPPLTPEEMAIVEEVTAQERTQAAESVTQANIDALAVNFVLDQMFIGALLSKDGSDVCQNLIEAIKTGKGFDAIKNAYIAQKTQGTSTYASLNSSLGSWRLTKLLGMAPEAKSTEDLFGEWIDVIPAPSLIEQLLAAGVPDMSTRASVKRYFEGDLSVETEQLALSKGVMLMRNAYRMIFDPVRGVPFAVSTDDRFAQIADIYLALNRGMIANKFQISNSTNFNVQVTSGQARLLTVPGENYTLDQLNKRLAMIVATLTADVLVGKNFSQEERSRLREALTKAAYVGGTLAVLAGIVYFGHQGYLGKTAQTYLSPIATKVAGGASYLGGVASTVVAKGLEQGKKAGETIVAWTPAPVKNVLGAIVSLGKTAGSAVVNNYAVAGFMSFVGSTFSKVMGTAPVAAPATPAAPVQQPTELRPMPGVTPEPNPAFGGGGAG